MATWEEMHTMRAGSTSVEKDGIWILTKNNVVTVFMYIFSEIILQYSMYVEMCLIGYFAQSTSALGGWDRFCKLWQSSNLVPSQGLFGRAEQPNKPWVRGWQSSWTKSNLTPTKSHRSKRDRAPLKNKHTALIRRLYFQLLLHLRLNIKWSCNCRFK